MRFNIVLPLNGQLKKKTPPLYHQKMKKLSVFRLEWSASGWKSSAQIEKMLTLARAHDRAPGIQFQYNFNSKSAKNKNNI